MNKKTKIIITVAVSSSMIGLATAGLVPSGPAEIWTIGAISALTSTSVGAITAYRIFGEATDRTCNIEMDFTPTTATWDTSLLDAPAGTALYTLIYNLEVIFSDNSDYYITPGQSTGTITPGGTTSSCAFKSGNSVLGGIGPILHKNLHLASNSGGHGDKGLSSGPYAAIILQ